MAAGLVQTQGRHATILLPNRGVPSCLDLLLRRVPHGRILSVSGVCTPFPTGYGRSGVSAGLRNSRSQPTLPTSGGALCTASRNEGSLLGQMDRSCLSCRRRAGYTALTYAVFGREAWGAPARRAQPQLASVALCLGRTVRVSCPTTAGTHGESSRRCLGRTVASRTAGR